MQSEKHGQLVEQLIELTENNKLAWEMTTDEDSFQVAFADYSIRFFAIARGPSLSFGGGNPGTKIGYRFEIVGETGIVLDDFSELELGGEWTARLKQLHTTIRRRLTGADQAIDSILSELDNMRPTTPPSHPTSMPPNPSP